MFDEISGLPAHPLLVHAAVIFIPLQVLAGIAYAVVPFTRKYAWWTVLALAVVGQLGKRQQQSVERLTSAFVGS